MESASNCKEQADCSSDHTGKSGGRIRNGADLKRSPILNSPSVSSSPTWRGKPDASAKLIRGCCIRESAQRANAVDPLLDALAKEYTPRQEVERLTAALESLRSETRAKIKRLRDIHIAKDNQIALLQAQLAAASQPHGAFNGRAIAIAIAKRYGFTIRDLKARSRLKHLVRARQHVMWQLREDTPMSLPEIGRFFGGLDHTTVLHGVRRHQARIDHGEVSR